MSRPRRVTVLRMGLGRDSMTLLVLLVAGKLVVNGEILHAEGVDAVVFTDPGHEWAFTYALIPRVRQFCEAHGLRFLVQSKPPAEGPDGWAAWVRYQSSVRAAGSSHFGTPPWRRDPPASIEARCASGYYHLRAPLFEDYSAKDAWIAKDDSSCTVNHKIAPNRELVADLQVETYGRLDEVVGSKKRLPWTRQAEAWSAEVRGGRAAPHLMLIGYAADEQKRLSEVAKPEGDFTDFETEAYPLMEMGIAKADEQALLDSLPGVDAAGVLRPGGFSDVRKSGCCSCKEQDVAQFWMLRELDPGYFAKVLDHEKRVVARTGPWQAIFPKRFVARDVRTGRPNPMVESFRRGGYVVGEREVQGREYVYVWVPLAERVSEWEAVFWMTTGRTPTVEEVAKKEYRGGCSVEFR